jgi:soluble epoxide hydrolase/lipid-phosphate phosphatase
MARLLFPFTVVHETLALPAPEDKAYCMFPEPRIVDTNGIRLAVHEQGSGPPVILLHGFPELAYSWRHQLPALAAAGYRAIAPDLRGYGASSKPNGVANYTIQELIGDVTGMMDSLDMQKAVIVGHDWGALLAWQMALLVPKRMSGLINLNIPFFPRPPIDPIAYMRNELGEDYYIVNFQDSDLADRTCAADPGRVFDVMMRRDQITRAEFDALPRQMRQFSLLAALSRTELSGEPILTPEERRVFVDAFTAGGFTGPINWYRNWTHNWETTVDVEQTVRVPTLFIGADNEVIVSVQQIAAMKPHVENLKVHMLENCGHWSQQEHPDEVNALILDWLNHL